MTRVGRALMSRCRPTPGPGRGGGADRFWDPLLVVHRFGVLAGDAPARGRWLRAAHDTGSPSRSVSIPAGNCRKLPRPLRVNASPPRGCSRIRRRLRRHLRRAAECGLGAGRSPSRATVCRGLNRGSARSFAGRHVVGETAFGVAVERIVEEGGEHLDELAAGQPVARMRQVPVAPPTTGRARPPQVPSRDRALVPPLPAACLPAR